jgi:hypothetical protein
MSSKKMIMINPNFLKVGGKGKTKKRDRKKRPDLRMSIKPNDIKKKLMAKIKQHQQERSQESATIEIKKDEDKFSKDFNKQIDYLEKIIGSKKEKKKRRKRKTKKRDQIVATDLSKPVLSNELGHNPLIKEAPPYGCLKNGTKPTYSQYNKTLKNREKVKISPIAPTPVFKTRQNNLEKLKEKLATPKSINKMITIKKTIKIYKLGKNKKTRSISVLIKSGKTRKLVKDEHNVLRKKCLAEIKLYLRKHNLIKIGSAAPEDVIRKLYEDSFLAGNIYNKNPENLLHNYLNEGEL